MEEAKRQLERAIQRHGRDRREQAIAELSARNPLLVVFVDRVRWAKLCERPIQFVERAELWSEIVNQGRQARREPTA